MSGLVLMTSKGLFGRGEIRSEFPSGKLQRRNTEAREFVEEADAGRPYQAATMQ